MKKIIIRIAVLAILFAATFLFVFRTIDYKTSSEVETTVKSQEATLPVITFSVNGNEINQTDGYTVLWDENCPRDSITPVSTSKEFGIFIDEKGRNIKRATVEVLTIPGLEVVSSQEISSLETAEDGRLYTNIVVDGDMTSGVEYLGKVTLMDDEGGYIYYYTRLQVTTFGSLTDNLAFVDNFHQCTLNKEEVYNLESSMETDDSITVTDFSHVDITADLDTLSFGDLNPTEVYKVVPTISEYNDTYVSVSLTYWIQSVDETTRTYKCHEKFRLNYTESKIYLLDYDRTMDELFTGSNFTVDNSYLDLGISSDKSSINSLTTEEGDIMLFSYQGTLWELNTKENTLDEVLSYNDYSDYDREVNNRYDFTLLSLDDNGDAEFAVYGQIGKGDYEGRCGVIYYRYTAAENRIQEMMFIPLNLDYKELDGAFGTVSYTSEFGIYYFTLFDSYYSYELETNVLHIEVEDLGDNWVYFEDSNTLVYNENPNPAENTRIVLLNVGTQEKNYITDPNGGLIDLQGSLDGRIVYGKTDASLISYFMDGSTLVPYTYVAICNTDTTIEADYTPAENIYVCDVTLQEKLIHMELYTTTGVTSDAGQPTFKYYDSDVIIDLYSLEEETSN